MFDFLFDTVDDEPKLSFRRLLILLLGVALVLAAGYVFVPPAYRHFKGWRSKRLAAQAERLLAQTNWTRALEKAQVAFLLKPVEPAAVRAMARVLTRTTNATALQFWQQLSNAGQATSDDRRTFLEFAIRLGALDRAALELQRLLAEAPNDPPSLWLASQLYLALGDSSQTVYYATRARLHDPGNHQYLLFLSSLLFDSPEPDKQVEARTNVWGFARDPGPLGLEALGFLAGRQSLLPEQRQDLIALLQQHPLSGIRQQLLVYDQQIRLAPQRRAEILDQLVAQCQTSTVPATANQLAVWLNQNEEFERTLTALPFERAINDRELFMPRMDALASLGRWAELEKILDSPRVPLEAVYLEAFRARCAMQLDKFPTAGVHWGNALSRAERNLAQLAWLAVYAEKCGAWEHAKKACRLLIACTADVRPAYQSLERLTAKSGTTPELRDLVGEMLKRWPSDPALRNDFAYLNLLLNTNAPEGRLTAEALVGQFPDSLPYRTTLALACHRLKDHPAALRVYEGRPYDWRLALPGNRAVYAAVLAANGRDREAREHARAIPLENLRKEELGLIQPTL